MGQTYYTYTVGGQLLTEDGPFTSDSVTNSYSNRLRASLVLQQPTGTWTNRFGYDSARRLTNASSPAGLFSYTLGGASASSPLPRKITLPNAAYITNSYDNVARLLATKLNNSSHSTLDSYAYVYNLASQPTDLARADASTVAYAYDPIGQLKVANSSVNSEDRGYAYDSAWNLNWRTNDGTTQSFTVDGKNQLTTDPTSPEVQYDGNGNLTLRKVDAPGALVHHFEAAYDDENRLVTLTIYTNRLVGCADYEAFPFSQSGFVYDGIGRLRIRTESLMGDSGCGWTTISSASTIYIYDGMRVIQERDGDNNPVVSYTRGSDLSGSLEGAGGIGGLLGRSEYDGSGGWANHAFYYADRSGNVTYMTDASQSMVASYRYDPFGNTISQSGALADANVYRFSSKEFMGTSGLYYFLYRYYYPPSQRWMNQDPIQEIGGVNLYRAIGNNPLGFLDPYGLNGFPIDFIGPLRPGDVYGPYLPDPSQRPPGWSPNWPTGSDPRGEYSQDPKSGTKYYPHGDDDGHWPHYDDSDGGRYPEKCEKPRPGQKQKPYGDQSPDDPWTQPTPSDKATPSPKPTPPIVSPVLIDPITPIPTPPLTVPEFFPFFEPVFGIP